MIKLNLTPTIDLQRPDKNGNFPIRIRSTIKGKQRYFGTKIRLKEEFFDKKTKLVVDHPNKTLLNSLIRNKMNELESKYIQQTLTGESTTEILPDKLVYFNDYAAAFIKSRLLKDSKKANEVKLSRLRKFNNFKSSIRLIDCTPKILEEFQNYCRKLGNSENTINGTMAFVMAVIHSAVKDKTLKIDPTMGFQKARYTNPIRDFLIEPELNAIERYIEDQNKHSNEANWFLLSCYCGLRFGDISTFDKSRSIVEGRIILRTSKSKKDLSIKIYPKLQQVIDRLGVNPVSTQKYNPKIKFIMNACNIEKKISSHIGRHTFAVLWLTKGGSMEVLSKLLGHSKQSTTQIYAQIVDLRIDTEVDRVFN